KLWSSATVKVVGSGVGGGQFLSELSSLIGEWEKPTRTYQTGHRGTGPSRSYSRQKDRIMDVADIAALPRGRAIVLAAGARPTLIRTVPWMETDQADAIRDSLDDAVPAAAPARALLNGHPMETA